MWVLENHVMASHGDVECHKTITLTTQSDYRLLDNLVHLVRRWKAPISVAIYSPGRDYFTTMETIAYFRECLKGKEDMSLIKEFVSFHPFFESRFTPKMVSMNVLETRIRSSILNKATQIYSSIDDVSTDCTNAITRTSFRAEQNLTYPINVARNIARDAALTHFIFPSDIELYPSDNLVDDFLALISKEEDIFLHLRRVYSVPVFEVKSGHQNPHTKVELLQMIKVGTAIRFHKSFSYYSHSVTESELWEKTEQTSGLK